MYLGLGDIKNYVLWLLSKGDLQLLQYSNYSLILSMITKIGSFFKRWDFWSLFLRVYGSRLSVIDCTYYNYYLIVGQYFAIVIILAVQIMWCNGIILPYIELWPNPIKYTTKSLGREMNNW